MTARTPKRFEVWTATNGTNGKPHRQYQCIDDTPDAVGQVGWLSLDTGRKTYDTYTHLTPPKAEPPARLADVVVTLHSGGYMLVSGPFDAELYPVGGALGTIKLDLSTWEPTP